MAFQTFAPRSVCGVSETNSATTPPPTESGHGKISPTTPPPPPNVVVFWGSRKMSATTPPPPTPTESGWLPGITDNFCYYPPHRTWSAAGAHGNVAPPPNKNPGYAGAPSMYRGSGNQMKIVPSYIVHALVTSLYTTYIFRGFVKKVLPQ